MRTLSHSVGATFDMGGLVEGLDALDRRFSPDVLAESLEEALESTRELAQQNLENVSSGKYSTGRTAAEGVQLVVQPASEGAFATIGLSKRGKKARAFIAYWLEFGVPARGIAARPWSRPAWDATKGGVVKLFAWALGKRVGLA